MSNFVPTNVGGVSILEPVSFPDVYLNRTTANNMFVNEEGDEMRGDLDMNLHTITDVKSPRDKNDVANKEYVDMKFDSVVGAVKQLIRKTETNSKHITEKFLENSRMITELKHYTKFKRFQAVLSNTKNISNFIFNLKDQDLTKNFTIIQILIETLPGAWYSLYLLSPTYDFRLYQYKQKLFIICHKTLPKTWTRKIAVVYQLRQ